MYPERNSSKLYLTKCNFELKQEKTKKRVKYNPSVLIKNRGQSYVFPSPK